MKAFLFWILILNSIFYGITELFSNGVINEIWYLVFCGVYTSLVYVYYWFTFHIIEEKKGPEYTTEIRITISSMIILSFIPYFLILSSVTQGNEQILKRVIVVSILTLACLLIVTLISTIWECDEDY